MRHSGHLNFDRNGYLLFYFFGGTSRPLSDDRHIVVGDIRIGLDWQIVKRHRPPSEQQDSNRQHHKPVVKGKVDQGANHCASTVASSGRTLETTCWPTLTPDTRSCLPPGSMSPA